MEQAYSGGVDLASQGGYHNLMAQTTGSHSVLLDFRGMEPAPERLIEIVRESAGLRGERLVVDWGGRFPWTLDRAAARRDAFPEQLVAAVDATVGASHRDLVVRLRSLLPSGYASRVSYRHLERARRDDAAEWRGALSKLASDLVDDLRSLLPSLAEIEVVAVAPEAEMLIAAAESSGLRGRQTADEPAEPLGGIEERLIDQEHPARVPRPIGEVHAALRAWREAGWRLVARFHEAVLCAAGDPARRGPDLVEAMKALSHHLRALREIRGRFKAVYEGLAADDAVAGFIADVSAPLHEQYAQLAARTASLRRTR